MQRLLPRRAWLIVLLAALPGCVPPTAAPSLAPPVRRTLAAAAVDPARIRSDATLAATVASVPGLSQFAREADAAGLTRVLAGAGPYTLLVPSDAAYARLATGVPDALLDADNRDTLVLLLRQHLVAGRLTTADVAARIRAGNGRAVLPTLAGQPLVATLTGDVVTLTSSTGNRAYIEAADRIQANGVLHVINGVLIPTLTPSLEP